MEPDILYDAACAFQRLFDIRYNIVLGKKKKAQNLSVVFLDDNFHHLAGLHKLKRAYPFQALSSAKIFYQILKRGITSNTIEEDESFEKIKERLQCILHLENMLDDPKTMFFGYDKNKSFINSNLEANYLLKGYINENIVAFTFFIKSVSELYANSTFPLSNYDYTRGQTQYTTLFIEKVYTKINKRNILFRHNKYIL